MYTHPILLCGLAMAGGTIRFHEFVGMGQVLYVAVTGNTLQLPMVRFPVFVVAVKAFLCCDRAQGKEKKDHRCEKTSHVCFLYLLYNTPKAPGNATAAYIPLNLSLHFSHPADNKSYAFGDRKKHMSETLSQSDLDALFGDLTPLPAEGAAETSELDKLLADLESLRTDAGTEKQEMSSVDSTSDSENLSQNEIDELIKQFQG